MLKTTFLFFITALCEIIGCFLPYLWLRKGAFVVVEALDLPGLIPATAESRCRQAPCQLSPAPERPGTLREDALPTDAAIAQAAS